MNFRIIALLCGSVALLMCATGINVVLTEPEEDTVLLIGSVIFELDNFDGREEIYKNGIELAVSGIYIVDNKEKYFHKWAVTDSSGYFFIPNAPANGKYEIKGFRFYLKAGGTIIMKKDFRDSRDQYKNCGWDDIMFSGTLFNKTASNRIVNLKHNLLTIRPTGTIEHLMSDMISEYTTNFGAVIKEPLIWDYFIENEKFKDSGWIPFLQKESQRYK